MINIDNREYPALQNIHQYHSDIDQIVSELKTKIALNCFWHSRWYDDNSKVDLCNHLKGSEWYYREKLFNQAISENPIKPTSSSFLLADTFSEDEGHMQKLGIPLKSYFDISHLLFIFEPNDDYYDMYFFAVPEKTLNANTLYLRHFDYIKAFIKDYQVKAKTIIEDSSIQKTLQTKTVTNQYLYNTVNNNLIELEPEKQQNLRLHKLTQREIQTLYWLAEGKTIPGIAMILGLSKRTIEDYVINIKTKLSCDSLFQIGQVIGSNKELFNVLFKETMNDS